MQHLHRKYQVSWRSCIPIRLARKAICRNGISIGKTRIRVTDMFLICLQPILVIPSPSTKHQRWPML
ncbi:MAG: DUF1431 domain-containing protein [Chitinophagia bacterium]|nr:DUF1431 domain-containing protein [Chitinophagia bacterium]